MTVKTMEFFVKLYLNVASTRILQISKKDYDKLKNQVFPNNFHIHIRYCDYASSYHFFYPMTGSKIPKWDCILNCCFECPGVKAPYLESSKNI